MGRLRIIVASANIEKKNRHLKEQFINGLNGDVMITEIITELTAINYTSSVTSKQALAWPKRVEAQRSQTAMLKSLRHNIEFDAVQSCWQYAKVPQWQKKNIPDQHHHINKLMHHLQSPPNRHINADISFPAIHYKNALVTENVQRR